MFTAILTGWGAPRPAGGRKVTRSNPDGGTKSSGESSEIEASAKDAAGASAKAGAVAAIA